MTATEWEKKKKEEEEKAKLTEYEKALGGITSKPLGSMTADEWQKIKEARADGVGFSPSAFTTDDDIAPVSTDVWFKAGEGDALTQAVGTTGDIILGLQKGMLRPVEGITDLVSYGVAGLYDLFGDDEFADVVRQRTQQSWVDETTRKFMPYQVVDPRTGEVKMDRGWYDLHEMVDKNSILGDKADAVVEGVGQVGGIILTGAAGTAAGLGAGGVSALTTATTGLSSMGTNMGEAYSEGATDGQAFVYGLTTGAIEAGTELLFGGLGKGIKALGISRGIGGLDDMLAKGLSDKITKLIAKDSVKKAVGNTIEALVKATGEGVEEVASGLGSALMKKFTYASDEELKKLIEDENLLESFIVGAVTSGIVQGGDYVKANANKTDFVTGRTTSEEKVIQRAAEQEIAKKEANGEKLTKKQKNEVYDRFAEDISRGYISIDTIEEALGGDKYTEYKKASDENATLKKELDELRTLSEYDSLRNMKSGDRTDIQNDRLAELKGKNLSDMTEEQKSRLAEIETKYGENTKTLEDMKKQMSDDVLNLVKSERKGQGSLLMESYNEQQRLKQGFVANYDSIKGKKYEDAARKTIDNAIKAGANNSNRVHDLVDMAAKLSAETGYVYKFGGNEAVKADFVQLQNDRLAKLEAIENPNETQLKEINSIKELIRKVKSGETSVNGNFTGKGIMLNLDSPKLLNTVVGHEMTHTLEQTKHYEALQKALFTYAKSKGVDIDAKIAELTELYKGVEGANAKAELTADLIGDYLFNDYDFVRTLAKDRNVFQRMWDRVKYLGKLATAGSKEARELAKVERMFEKAYQESVAAASTDSYSLSSIANTFFDNPNMSAAEFRTRDYTETQGYKDYVDKAVNTYLQTHSGVDADAARSEIERSIAGIVRVAIKAKDAGYDIYDDAAKRSKTDSKNRLLFSSLEPNTDYFTSSDISTICDKRKNFAEIYDEIVRQEEAKNVPKGKRFFDNVDNYFAIHKIMADKGLTTPCRQCYVESMRKNLAPMAQNFLKLVQEGNPTNTANDQLYHQKGKNKGNLKTNNASLRELVQSLLPEYNMSISDLTIEMLSTEDGLAQLKIQAPLIYEAFNSFYGQAKPKLPRGATPFRFGELTALLTDENGEIKQGLVNKINAAGGFRLQSYSDFQVQNYVDVLQTIFEAGTLGLSGHAYTKVPAFLEATEGTNLKRNISIFMYNDNGQWKIDRNDSFPYPLEDIYKIVNKDKSGNTGIVAVSQNEDMSAWIMANDNIGYGIPFHKSGLKMDTVRDTVVKTEDGREIKGYSGIKDHTKWQTEVWANTTSEHKANTKVQKGINIYEEGLWDFENKDNLPKNELIEKNVKSYIDECEKRGYLPKFRDYVMNNGRVLNNVLEYSKQLGMVDSNATIDDISFKYEIKDNDGNVIRTYQIPYGYYKFLGDFGMFTPDGKASPHEALSLKDYDFDKAEKFFEDAENLRRNEILQQFANGNEREKYRKSDFTAGELADIIKQKRDEVVGEVVGDDSGNVAPYSLSTSDYIAPINSRGILGRDFRVQEDIAPLTMESDTVGGVDTNADTDNNQTVSERIAAHRDELRAELDELIRQQKFDAEDIDIDIAMAEAEYKNIKNKKSDKANNLLQEIKRLEKMKATVDNDYKKRIAGLQKRINKLANMSDVGTQEMYVDPAKKEHKKANWWNTLRTHVLDDASVIEDWAKKTKNRELESKFNFTKSAKARAQSLIGNGKKDAGIKSLTSIREAVEKTGKTAEFEDYMYHLLNIDRMTLEDRYEGATNKPVFDKDITADISAAKVRQYEAQNPQFKRLADDVYKFVAYERQLMVDNGLISQETANLWQEQTPHYIPIKRSVADDSPVNTSGKKKINVDSTVKRVKGGDQPIEHLFDTIASRTERVFSSIAKNNFGLELKNTLNSVIDSNTATQDDVDNGVDRHDDLLQAGKEGKNPTFTVFENGEKVTFEISHDMYEALKPTEEMWKGTSKVLNKINNFRRGVLTEYSIPFLVSNSIKDAQSVLNNSQHALKTYKNFPKAIKELKTKGKWFTEYIENGGEQNSYFEKGDGFKKDDTGIKKLIGIPLNAISNANQFIERIPRLAEYIASRENGASIETAMLDAARVTTNFQAGGDITKFANRNGATFLNASVQGLMQNVRNVREAKMNGLKGVTQLIAKTMLQGLPAILLNHLIWGDDEEYEELSDYVKDNYYIIAKYGDGKFVRIPKGREAAVIQNAFEQMANLITGNDEVDLESFFELVMNNLAPNNLAENNIIAPLTQAWSNTTWYGDDLVPTRLQDLPAGEQYDESIDAISKWLGEKTGEISEFLGTGTGISPYKINYVLDQYSGAIGDFVLPMLTPEAERGENALLAPLADKFTTDSTMKNQNVSDFYDAVDKLSMKANSSKATDEDILKSKYMNSINSELSELYKQKREIQNSTLSDTAKYNAVREVQKQINELAEQSLDTYDQVYINGDYARVGDRHYRANVDGEWQKITDEQFEKMNKVTKGLGISADEYWGKKQEYDFAYEHSEKYAIAQKVGGYEKYMEYQDGMKGMTLAEKADYVGGLNLTPEQKNALINGETTRKEPIDMAEYSKYSSLDEMDFAKKNPEKYAVTKAVGGYDIYKKYTKAINDISSDKDANGKTIGGSRQEKVIQYLENLDIPYGVKIILYRNEYNGDDYYCDDIVRYVEALDDLTYQEKLETLAALGMTVDQNGNIWY